MELGRTAAHSSFSSQIFGTGPFHAHPDGEYVLCFGRSLRNYDSFIDAVEALPYPAAIPAPNFELLRAHGSRFSRKLTDLPARLKLLEDNGTPSSLIELSKVHESS